MAKEEKSEGKKLKEKLLAKKKNSGLTMTETEIKKADKFCEGYKKFVTNAKTEREAAAEAVKEAEKNGFEEYVHGKKYKPGDKFYYLNRKKAIILCVMGKKPLSDGVRIAVAHIDSPRLDLKQNPLYESDELALFKTHYYSALPIFFHTLHRNR